jgi:hypothetical protein
MSAGSCVVTCAPRSRTAREQARDMGVDLGRLRVLHVTAPFDLGGSWSFLDRNPRRQPRGAGTIVRSASRRMAKRNGVSRFRISPSIAAPIRDPLVFITIDEAVYVSNLS